MKNSTEKRGVGLDIGGKLDPGERIQASPLLPFTYYAAPVQDTQRSC